MTSSGDADQIHELLERGGWVLVDPTPVATEHPDTFHVPSQDERAALGPGDVVRAMFRVVTICDVARDGIAPWNPDGTPALTTLVERMWGVVMAEMGDVLDVELTNTPFATHSSLSAGARILLPRQYVIAVDEQFDDVEEWLARVDDRAPSDHTLPMAATAKPRMTEDQAELCRAAGVDRPEPPFPFSIALVAKDLTPESALIHGVRFDPDHERNDSGWIFFAGDVDLDDVMETIGVDVVRLDEAYQRCPRMWDYVVLPSGWGFSDDGEEHEAYELEVNGD